MAKVLNLIKALDHTTDQYDDFILNLLSTHSDIPFDSDEIDTVLNLIISTVNTRLNQTITRYDGLNILFNILPKCSNELLSKHASLWISKAVQVLESSQSETRQLTLACKVLANLAISSKKIPELQKLISMQILKQLVTIISNIEQNKRCGAIFYLLATLMYHYKESSEKMQMSLRKLILSTIDVKQKNLVQAGANCFTLLARATERTFKPPSVKPTYTCWIYSQALICNSLHVIMDNLFSDIMELETIDIWVKLELPYIPETNLFDYYSKLERRFENLCVFLSTMLRGCAGRNSVCPSDILKVLCRGLAITPVILQLDTVKHQMLNFILPKLHINLLMILNSLIDGFRQELLPYAKTILKLYTQTLKWSENIQQNSSTISGVKPFESVRKAIYKSLSLWLTHLSTFSAIEIAADEIIPYLLKDITPEKDRVILTVDKTQNLSKKALKRFIDSQYENSAVLGGANMPVEKNSLVNADLCREALFTLENIIKNSSSFMKLSLYRTTQNLIVSLLYDVYLATDEISFYRKNHNCRYNLLKVLRAIQMTSHPLISSPTQYSIEIFTLAMNDEKIEIVKEARSSLMEIEKIVHPCAATLQFPLANNEQKNDDTQTQTQVDVDMITTDNDQQECHNSDGQIGNSNSVDNSQQSINNMDETPHCDRKKNMHNESIENINEENFSEPKLKKQRILNDPDDSCAISVEQEINCERSPPIIEEESSSNLQDTKSVLEYVSDKTIKDYSDDESMSSVENTDEINCSKNITQKKLIPGLEDDSNDEAILGLFCDELKEN